MIALLIPTGSDHDRTRIPTATLSLIVINVAIYFISNLRQIDGQQQVAQAGQLFAYYLAVHKGLDPDKPRGLRKVTLTY